MEVTEAPRNDSEWLFEGGIKTRVMPVTCNSNKYDKGNFPEKVVRFHQFLPLLGTQLLNSES